MNMQIKDYENYLIYDNGDVYNTSSKKFLKGSISENGYKYYRLSKNNKKTMFYAHRLVAMHFLPNDDNLPVVNHKDGNKLNNNVSNLEWVTYSENTQHWKNTTNVQRRPTEYYTEDLPGEIWKEFGSYYVSSVGRVRHKTKNNILKPSFTNGYYKIRLSEKGLVSDYMVHQLVYKLFKEEDYDTKTQVIDHIDGNKLNNDINNLRILSNSENAFAALYVTQTNKTAKAVAQYDKQGNLLNTFPSTKEAARQLGLDSSTISKVCRGNTAYKSHGGFVFKYI